MDFNHDQLKEIYEKMLIARYFEEEVERQHSNGLIKGPVSLSIGQEASAIGAGAALEEDDYVTVTHRGHAQALGAGTSPNALMAELFGKSTGVSGGRAGSKSFIDANNNVLGQSGIISAGFPLACGVALTQKLKNTGNAVLCFGGDGSVNEGNFHEALNLAAVWKLPVVFFIENNLYARSTPLEEHSSVINLSDRAASYNIPGITVDGNDAIETYGITKLALDYARRGEGPVLIEAQTYRISPDSSEEKKDSRPRKEIEGWMEEDPIPRLADYLLSNNYITTDELYDLDMKARRTVGEALNFARDSKDADEEDIQIYSE